jgi:parvulin-like peptidyl-prolyl isomerase
MNEFNKSVIEPEEIINFLKSEINLKDICHQILCKRVIARFCMENNISLLEEEIKAEAEKQRRVLGLEKASDTVEWLRDELISAEDWEEGIRSRLLAGKVAEYLFAKEVEKFYIKNRLEFEQILLYQILVKDEKLAQELYYQIEEQEISFFAAARIYDVDEKRRLQCGYEGKVYRFSLPPDIAAILFSTSAKQLIGPLKTDQGYNLFLVEELIPPELDSHRFQEILDNMFQRWLTAEVEALLDN